MIDVDHLLNRYCTYHDIANAVFMIASLSTSNNTIVRTDHKGMWFDLDGVNPKYIELDRYAGKGFRHNFVECYCADDRRSELCDKLKAKEYGAHEAVELSREEGRNIILYI